jgi:arsenite methyltransferase
MSATARPHYGIDAPGVVRNLLLVGAAGLAVWASAALGLWSGLLGPVCVAGIGAGMGVSFLLTGCFMLWHSLYGKLRARERLLDLVPWRGDESVLDVGCGRGLMLVGAAKRVPRGRATGIDVWQAEDLSGNRPEAALENATREGVAERVEVKTADMRQMPFPDASFDVVVSNVAIHNLYDPKERERALAEVARVLRPGGTVLIADIRHHAQYADALREHGLVDVRRASPAWKAVLAAVITFGSVRPATLLARKPG